MDKPKLKQWVEKDLNLAEEFIVFTPCRINANDGKGAKAYAKGQPVTLLGPIKKELYFQNKIMYKKDFDLVVAFEKEQKQKFSGSPEVSKESAEDSQKDLKSKKN